MSTETLPEGWVVTDLATIAKWGSGGTPTSTDSSYYGGDIPWLVIGDLADGPVSDSRTRITKAGLENSSAKMVPVGAVLVAMYGSIGKLGIAAIPVSTNQAIAFAVCEPDLVFNKFLFFYLLNIRDHLYSLGKGGTQRNISQTVLKSVRFSLPPLAEQKRIVAKIEELFSELEAGEESLRVARRQLGVYRQSLLKQAFEGHLTAKWRTQNPAKLESPSQLLARIQSARQSPNGSEASSRRSRKGAAEIALENRLVESLPRLPESWQWTALGNLVNLITKGSSPKWQGFDYTDDTNGVLFVTSENVRTGYLDLSRPKYLGLGFNEIQPASVLNEGDVLLNIVGASIGRAAVFNRTTLANINQAVSVIRPTIYLDRAFLTYHLNSSRTYQLVTSKAVDVARANFSLADVNEVPVPLCSNAVPTD